MSDFKTVVLSGEELKVDKLGGKNTVIVNFGSAELYASAYPGIVPDGDSVAAIPAGGAVNLRDTYGTVYLLGTGKVQLMGTDYKTVNVGLTVGGSGGGTPENTSVFNGLWGEGLPVFHRKGSNVDYEITYKMLTKGGLCLDYSKSYSINGGNDYYTDASVISSEKMFDLRNYSKIAVTAIAFKNDPNLPARVYFKTGGVELSQPHIPYDFSSWISVCEVSEYSANYNDPGEPVTFEIDISDVNEASVINFGIYHGDEILGYTVYFYIVKIEFLK